MSRLKGRTAITLPAWNDTADDVTGVDSDSVTDTSVVSCYAPPLGSLSNDACLMSDVCLSEICLSRTSGLSREQRGLGRLKLAQR